MPPSKAQRQFLAALGCRDTSGMTIDSASAKITELLALEKASGATFPCPYCGSLFGPRPKHRKKKCPACQRIIVHVAGKFLTEEQYAAAVAKQKALSDAKWRKEQNQLTFADAKEAYREERSFRREFEDVHYVGWLIDAGPECKAAQALDGLLVLIEHAAVEPTFLPPYADCSEETCECDITLVRSSAVPPGTHVIRLSDDAEHAAMLAKAKPLPLSDRYAAASPVQDGIVRTLAGGARSTRKGPYNPGFRVIAALLVLFGLCCGIGIAINVFVAITGATLVAAKNTTERPSAAPTASASSLEFSVVQEQSGATSYLFSEPRPVFPLLPSGAMASVDDLNVVLTELGLPNVTEPREDQGKVTNSRLDRGEYHWPDYPAGYLIVTRLSLSSGSFIFKVTVQK